MPEPTSTPPEPRPDTPAPAPRLARTPGWNPATRLHRDRVPAHVRAWLFAAGSLTAHVRAQCPGQFHLRVLREQRTRAFPGERQALDLLPCRRARVREVALCCAGEPLVVARSVIPLSTLRGRQARLAGLGERPLGALLFADPSTRREPYEIARLALSQAGFSDPPPVAARVWGRRAVYRLGGAPLLVCEFFLPALVEATRR